jgi:hypothetical protein
MTKTCAQASLYFPEFGQYLNHNGATGCIDEMFKEDKKGKAKLLFSFFKQAVKSSHWKHDKVAVKLVEKAFEGLKKKDKKGKLSSKLSHKFSKVKAKYKSQVKKTLSKKPKSYNNHSKPIPKPHLFTTKITKIENLVAIDKLCKIWLSKSLRKEKQFTQDVKAKPLSKKTLHDFTHVIRDFLAKKNTLFYSELYVAFDSAKKVQGVALAQRIPSHRDIYGNGMHIAYLATSPDNIPLYPKEKKVAGVGTHLVLQVVREMQKNSLSKITVNSLETPVGFYQKLGFEKFGEVSTNGLTIMILPKEKADNLLKAHTRPHSIDAKEPILKMA